MTSRLGIALKLTGLGVAVAVLAFHGLSRIGGHDPNSVLAAQRPESRGVAFTPGDRSESRNDAGHGMADAAFGVQHAAPQRDDRPTTGIEGEENPPVPESPVSQPFWWWPFGGSKEPDEPARQPEPAPGVFVRLSSPPASTAAASPTGTTNAALIEFIGITRSGGTLPGDEFSVGQTRDLKIVVWWALNSQHVQRLELLSPDGSLYQRLQTSFDADTSKFVQRGNQSYMSVETILPVAGTWITDHSLFGPWTVNVYLDDDEAASRVASFVVSP